MTNPEVIYPNELHLEAKKRAESICIIPNGTIFVRAAGRHRLPALHIEIYGEEYAIVCPPPGAAKRHETKWGVKINITNHYVEYYASRTQAVVAAMAYGAGIYPPLCEND